ncbi:MAG: chloramphenicol phosphotransferase CPT family protein [Marinibacterium sp.]|nr:chloramphenicol phosphotransferase CPT family protein [Marinibacterium sp.]
MARVIFLHGPSSSGKSTLAAALLASAPSPFLHLSIDHLRDSGAWDPRRYSNWPTARAAFFDGFHRAVGGFADAGNDLILEHVLDTPGWHADLQHRLGAHQVLFVGLTTPLETLQSRERQRGDRPIGSAEADFHSVHRGLTYDLSLDGTAAPEDGAMRVWRCLARHDRSAFFAPVR